MTNTNTPAPANELPSHDNSDFSVIEKAGMSLGHAPAGLLLPGIDGEIHKEATCLCARDYLEHHVFFNNIKFHNHLNHHLLAAYSMGASVERLQEIFDGNRLIQRSSLSTHEAITIDATNYINYLSQEKYYLDLVRFFHKELDAAGDGWHSVVAKYIFEPHLFPLVMSGFVHPFIQLGYALEFESKAIAATALAQTCKSDKMRDERINMKIPFSGFIFAPPNAASAERLAAKYAKRWVVDADEKAIDAKYYELLSVVSLWYIALTRPGYRLMLDFFTMHLLFIAPEHTAADSHSIANESYGDSVNPWFDVFEKAISSNDMYVPKVIHSLWRGNLLCSNSDTSEQAPSVNWLYIAHCTVDNITANTFVSDLSKSDVNSTWEKGMYGYDEFWVNKKNT
ncbi:hypothetical protein GGI25_001218 [Coemansia spiralis]|uniref:Questin oxidase n=1 Tax=Coemansia spiralis TaxID=417178 RepID=A0A9W8GD57_9FUNG|nr:hypothetical protein GGI25_001218 [Coemansia spiralis]